MNSIATIPPFRVMGIEVRTKNADGRAGKDLKHLWDRFFREQIMDNIPDRDGNDIYAVYTDYESDHSGEYTTILGCKVSITDNIPQGLTVKDLGDSTYTRYTVEGRLPDIVINTWTDIWNNKTINRAFTSDFEVYDAASFGSESSRVDIYVAMHREQSFEDNG